MPKWMMEGIAIGEYVKAISDALGLDYESVARLDITPGDVDVEVFRRNEIGAFYVDEVTGEVAKDLFSFKITT